MTASDFMTDLHCHLLPYVDDGAEDLDEAIALLHLEAEQGVSTICFTPHLRQGIFETPDTVVLKQFQRLCRMTAAEDLPLALYCSREYHWDRLFRQKLEAGDILPLGRGKTLLLEFSSRHSLADIRLGIRTVLDHGFIPLIAHVERYPAAAEASWSELQGLVNLGALLQINCGSVLGQEGRRQKQFARRLLESRLISVVGSDAHDTQGRVPMLNLCYTYLMKKLGREEVQRLFCDTPQLLLRSKEE